MIFWSRYLIVIGILLFVTGLWIALFKDTHLFDLFVNSVEVVFWPDNQIPESVKGFRGFIYSFSGTYLSLWGLFMVFISKYALLPGNKWAWYSLVSSTIVWFTIMFPSSMYYNVYYNAIGDVIFLCVLVIPFTKTYKFIFTASNC